ncbi:MAG: InlB B-repeat-containing protein, partial [Defluviitaleaceae bacterium]|nr:InlB B-repeat-containing protein [Defluviitaleaceae bacterium]
VPATIPPITLNTWDAIMDSLELGHLGIPIGNPTRTGYHFMGWYLDADFTVAITEVFRMPARNATLYARWEIH